MKTRGLKSVAMLGIATLAFAGCSTGTNETTTPESADPGTGNDATTEATAKERDLVVFAAASMEPTFTELAKQFEENNPGVTVKFNFAGSQDLQEQILGGAPADVFASANEKQMEPIVEAGLNDGEPQIFVTNTLEIVTPPGNPAGITNFASLAQEDLKLVICAPEVPCGSATKKVEESTGVTLKPVSEEDSVTNVLAKVQAGEGDAGLVYQTDAKAAGDTVLAIPFPESDVAVNKYPIVALKAAPQAELASAWVDFILSADVQAFLGEAGFGLPS
ncbi:molybdate ABC transporter substrate-binding protein [Actinomycetaceae bacterium MB13-C1-2]|nr:molybdate ABC transporter substrate-binding protein [Actinomycetaceae bacterium MB13-C1-2]